MSEAIENLQAALARVFAGRPKVGGFPYLAETLRQAGVTRNLWFLPACQSLYLTKVGPVVNQGTPLLTGTFDVPQFDHVPAGGTDDDGEAPPVVGGGPLSVGVLPIEVVSI